MYEKELEFLKETLVSASLAFCHMDFSVSDKGRFDVVTDADRNIERYFANKLRETFPGDTLHGEEFTSDAPLQDRTWILDPIDGTYNFSTDSHLFAHQAALWDHGALQICAIYFPVLGEMYEAVRGCGSFCNGSPIRISDRVTENAIVSFGDFPHGRPQDARDEMKLMECAYSRVARMRMFGAASADFAFLASGKTEGVVLFTKNKWDIAPGWLLCQEAGAFTFGVEHEPYSFSSRGIFACNRKELYEELMIGLEKKYD